MALGTSAQQVSSANYDVFLSFRGIDTRNTFTDHLYKALDDAKFHTFRDNKLERGKDMKSGFVKAIQQSRSSIIVFSKDYASSKWCLDELVMILKQMRTSGHFVLPVFYRVDPEHVRGQTGSFAKAFGRHEESESVEKLKEWKGALSEAADLSGMVCQKFRRESMFIKDIVAEMEDKLKRHSSVEKPYPFYPEKITITTNAEGLAIQIEDHNKRHVSIPPSHVVPVSQSGSDSCFKCGKPGHWAPYCHASSGGGGSYGGSGSGHSSVPEKRCLCGAGVCMVLTAKTEKNRGRKFYTCPVRQENGKCGFFEWCDNA